MSEKEHLQIPIFFTYLTTDLIHSINQLPAPHPPLSFLDLICTLRLALLIRSEFLKVESGLTSFA